MYILLLNDTKNTSNYHFINNSDFLFQVIIRNNSKIKSHAWKGTHVPYHDCYIIMKPNQ